MALRESGILMQLEIVTPDIPLPEHREALLELLDAYNDQHFPDPVQTIALLIKDLDNGKIIGGLWGVTYWNWLFVDQFVVPESCRGQGLGTRLLRQAEDIARQRGCIGVWLYTFSFQAPHFYKQRGYAEFGQISDYPPGQACFYFSKRL